MKIRNICCLIFVITLVCSSSRGSFAFFEGQEEKSLLGFAHHLFEKEHYYQAITEYERFIYFNPDHPYLPDARLQIAFCYKRGGKYDKAIEHFRSLAEVYYSQTVGIEAAFQIGECYFLSGAHRAALIAFQNFIADNPRHSLTDKARWETAWAYIYLEDYSSAADQLIQINKSSNFYQPAQEVTVALQQLPHLPRKSPLVAGLLAAVIPGAGHLYTGKKKQALFSFFTNALLFFGSYEAFNKELYTAGGFLTLFSINYYSGNIFGALNSAHHYNRETRDSYLDKIRHKYTLPFNYSTDLR